MRRRSYIWAALGSFVLFAFFVLASQLQAKTVTKASAMAAPSDNAALLEMASGQSKFLQPQLDWFGPGLKLSGRLFWASIIAKKVPRDRHVLIPLSYCPMYRRPPPATL